MVSEDSQDLGQVKRLGIIGGMGPMATVLFLEMIISLTDAKSDQEHIPIVIEHCPEVPDRTGYIFDNNKPDPVPYIIDAAERLAVAGVSEIVIPCFTAHYFHDRIQDGVGIPIINGIDETVLYLKDRGIRAAGVMATDGTVKSDLYGHTLSEKGIDCIYPDSDMQRRLMSVIYDYVKAGVPVEADMFYDICESLKAAGAETMILGCTELSVAWREIKAPGGHTPYDITDAMEILAKKCVRDFGRLKDESASGGR